MPEIVQEIRPLSPLSRWSEYQNTIAVPINWVVDKILAAGDITILASEGGLGKSWKAAHIAMKVANGESVDGVFHVKQGNVLWYDNENGPDENAMRCRNLDREIGFKGMKFKTNDVYFQEHHWIADDEGIETMRKRIVETNPVLIVIDSLVSIFPSGSSENSATDVRIVMDRLMEVLRFSDDGSIRQQPIAALVLHHTKKESQNEQDAGGWPTYRGSTDFKNACSFMIIMRGKEINLKDGTKETRVQSKWVKSRRGRMPKDIYEFALKDHGVEDSPEHWVEYVAYGKAVDFEEYIEEEIRSKISDLETLTAVEIGSRIKGFPTDRRRCSELCKKMVENGVLSEVSAARGQKAAIYAKIS